MVIPSSAVTMRPKGTPAPTSSVEVQVFEERVDLSNDMTWRQMIAVASEESSLREGELDKLEGPKYAARRGAELRRAARARERQAAAPSKACATVQGVRHALAVIERPSKLCPTSGLLCGRLLVALVESVLRPGGWENMCRV